MRQMNVDRYVFPFLGINKRNEKIINYNICGTLTYIDNGIFLTAGHVVEYAKNYTLMAVGFKNINEFKFFSIIDFEIFRDIDIAIVKIKMHYDIFESLPMRDTILPLLSDVYTFGYPFAINEDSGKYLISRRALKGYIVHTGRNIKTPNITESYELSFYCPRGISGAPLVYTEDDSSIFIQGIIIGNSESEIPIGKAIETDDKIYEKSETTFFGIAINILSFIEKKSKLLGKSIKEYLLEEKLYKN